MGLTVEVAGKTDIGCVRTSNEDNLGWDQRLGLYVVCDGMGGALAGEVASKMGVDLLLDYFREAKLTGHYPQYGKPLENGSERARALHSAIQRANSAIHEAGKAEQSQRGMGSTIVAVLVEGNYLTIGHVGDSRIYLLRHHVLQQLTQDHSLVMEQVRRGMISREEAERSDIQNIIIRALGSEETVQPDIEELSAFPGDILLLASDGLTKLVKEEVLQMVLENTRLLDAACEDLIKAAREKGGDDNITCLLLRMIERPWYKKLLRRSTPGGGPAWQNSI